MDLRRLQRIAEVTERRGPHAFGFAWIDADGTLKHFKQTGAISDHLGVLTLAKDARMLIGHCRYATHGDPAVNKNNHPHRSGRGWIVHNGQLVDYLRVAKFHDLNRRTDCDSEVLALLIAKLRGEYFNRCRNAVRSFNPAKLVMLGLWADQGGRMAAVRRRGQPLHAGGDRNGSYFASLRPELPGEVVELPDDYGFVFDQRGAVFHGAV